MNHFYAYEVVGDLALLTVMLSSTKDLQEAYHSLNNFGVFDTRHHAGVSVISTTPLRYYPHLQMRKQTQGE